VKLLTGRSYGRPTVVPAWCRSDSGRNAALGDPRQPCGVARGNGRAAPRRRAASTDTGPRSPTRRLAWGPSSRSRPEPYSLNCAATRNRAHAPTTAAPSTSPMAAGSAVRPVR
jgi:hypothetical protein